MHHLSPVLADALLPSVVLISPITVLLLIPIIAVEAGYVSRRLKMAFWRTTSLMALGNVASTILGFPITTALSLIQHKAMLYAYGSEKANFDRWMTTGDQKARAFSFGHYPEFAVLLGACITLIVCFLVSWWVEYIVVLWRLKRRNQNPQLSKQQINEAVRNANILSYLLLAPVVLFFFSRLSFPQF